MLNDECLRSLKLETDMPRPNLRSNAFTPRQRGVHHPVNSWSCEAIDMALFSAEGTVPRPIHRHDGQLRHSDEQHWPPADGGMPDHNSVSKETPALSSDGVPATAPAKSSSHAPLPCRAPGLSAWQVRKAQTLLADELDCSCPIAKAAAECGLSLGYFARMFKKSVGLAPHRWVTSRRVEAAVAMLRDTSLPLCDIALECGFCEQAHMCRVFRKWLGTTPAAWRRKIASS